MTSARLLATTFGVLLGLVAACADPVPPTEEDAGPRLCFDDDDCPAGHECIAAFCVSNDVEEDIFVMDDTTPDTAPDAGDDLGADVSDADAGTPEGGFGAPCTTDDVCDSGYCIDTAEGRICTAPCVDECPNEDWECRYVPGGGADLIRLCVPPEEILCTPCRSDIDCGSLVDLCLDFADGTFCGQACIEDADCPDAYGCTQVPDGTGEVVGQCTPLLGICGDCLDADGDGFGEGPGCFGSDCDDLAAETYESALEVCDGFDNDCDEIVDEGFDFVGDPFHCGRCMNACSVVHGAAGCEAGACVIVECDDDYYDHNGEFEDGCEDHCLIDPEIGDVEVCNGLDDDCDGLEDEDFDLARDADNCGECGAECAPENAVGLCVEGECTVEECMAPHADCNGFAIDGCEIDTSTDRFHCGECEAFCDVPGAVSICEDGVCAIGECDDTWQNCNREPEDGCEVNLWTDEENCGACGFVCAMSGAVSVCIDGGCAVGICGDGLADCDLDRETGCEIDVRSDPENCGACGHICGAPRAEGGCIDRWCVVDGCELGWHDANGLFDDGCEYECTPNPDSDGVEICNGDDDDCDGEIDEGIDLTTDDEHCGACGRACDPANAEGVCDEAECTIVRCGLGFEDCNGLAADGCEVAVQFDPLNCGACGAVCEVDNARSTCFAGICRVDRCIAPWEDCDLNPANGCESNLDSDEEHCGACRRPCAFGTGTGICDEGTCLVGGCFGDLADCDGRIASGCEVDLGSDRFNCGGCDIVCSVSDALERCVDRACEILECDGGFDDCDGFYGNGCEADLNNDPDSCRTCGHVCDLDHARPRCVAGGCEIAACDEGFANCDLEIDNGCEANLETSEEHCGGCRRPCVFDNGVAICDERVCALAGCSSTFADCNDWVGDGCEVDTATDPDHCGGCRRACELPHATAGCEDGGCAVDECASGWEDCDGIVENGCETDINTSIGHCGRCGAVCALANATPECVGGTCRIEECDDGFADCDLNGDSGCEINLGSTDAHCGICNFDCHVFVGPGTSCVDNLCELRDCAGTTRDCDGTSTNGCEIDVSDDVRNCGACGTVCSVANASEVCDAGSCEVADCTAGFRNCDELYANGCEVNFNNDPRNCGECGNVCDFTAAVEACVAGTCAIGSCQGTNANCNLSTGDGCEVNVALDPLNCGVCGNVCGFPNAVPRCAGGACGILACEGAYRDCDALLGNGCETDSSTDAFNCGGCGEACLVEGGVGTCIGGFCDVGTCIGNFGDCDDNPLNGCEADLFYDEGNCGACGRPCAPANGAGVCDEGECAIETCLGAFEDCDGDADTGCEANTASSLNNCGGCGLVCDFVGASESCVAGDCRFGVCLDGFYDANDDPSDGCEYECTFIDPVDVPDPLGIDTNCDGLDGDLSRTIFVWEGGSDGFSGLTPAAPVRSLNRALVVAAGRPDRDTILLATGTYTGAAVELIGGVSIYGGYSSNFQTRSLVAPTVRSLGPTAAFARGLAGQALVDRVAFVTADRPGPSEHAATLVVSGSSDLLTLRDVELRAGRGSDGGAGAPGQNRTPGHAGFGGAGSSGGTGGWLGAGRGGNGRRRGRGEDGTSGSANGGPCGGGGGDGDGSNLGCADGDPRSGDNGGRGCDGRLGAHGAGGSDAGSWSGIAWSPSHGVAGTAGTNGGGGGGGGAGGGEDCNIFGACIFCGTGRGGGGGGGGGLAGTGGGGGGGGGASIALVVDGSIVNLDGVTITTSGGGAGGRGGSPGVGGGGGGGGSGAPSGSNTDGAGGDGGDGGTGGGGGCGGGGGGGPSVAVWGLNGGGLRRVGAVSFATGPAGTGGTSCRSPGAAGVRADTRSVAEL